MPPLAHTYLFKKEGAGGKGPSLAPLLTEELEPDRVSGTWAQRIGTMVTLPTRMFAQSVTLSSAFWLLLSCPISVLLVLRTLS